MNLGLTYVELARYNDALRELDRAAELSGRRDLILAMKAYACGVAGDITRARHALEDLEARAEQGSISAMLPTYGCIGIGEHDRAFRWLDRAVADHAGLLIYLKVEPMFDRLRADPRLITLMRRLDMAC